MGPDAMEIWDCYRRGKITHFEAMQRFFSHAPANEVALQNLLWDMRPDPRLADCVAALEANGWELVVVSAGCSWYIDRILQNAGVRATVHANPGEIISGRGLVMTQPRDSPFFCPDVGIDKAAVVRAYRQKCRDVLFAGDGPPDIAPALLVNPDRRFARGFLAKELQNRNEKYGAFEKWSDIVETILRKQLRGGLHPT